ncbi:hypothetical protein ACUH7Y_09395 [Clostridium beijerinckii]|uniref:Uncharacterized protein n=1 Tax=Clostridium beijerinckii TaxID=1520 RepID=A0A7X9SMA6_CLOBE|nr:hypothetical protein [Clostridium beijerinckii]NMF04526.1 hypothetical protein [Clostridium beijerinckii]
MDLSKAVGEKWIPMTGREKGLPLFLNQDELERANSIVNVLEGMSIESAQELLNKVNIALLQLTFIN